MWSTTLPSTPHCSAPIFNMAEREIQKRKLRQSVAAAMLVELLEHEEKREGKIEDTTS